MKMVFHFVYLSGGVEIFKYTNGYTYISINKVDYELFIEFLDL